MLRRRAKSLLVVLAVALALALTIVRRGDSPAVVLGPSPLAAAPERYELDALRIFNLTLHRVKENYVDPTRIDPRKMLLASFDYVQRGVAEVMVDTPAAGRITVRVDDAKADFDVSGVDSPWTLSAKMKEILQFIAKHVHSGTDVREIEYDAINGFLSTLDPHSQLLKPEVYKEMQLQTRGEFGGLGIVIGNRKGQLTIIRPMEKTPAARAGLKPSDRIMKINDESTVNLTLTEAVSRLRGTPGTKVTIFIERGTSSEQHKVVLTREIIRIESIKSKLLKSSVGYVSIENFQGNTTDDLSAALKKLTREGAKSFILDLRGNPGGLLDQAVKVSDLFLTNGTVVTTVGMGGKQRDSKLAESDDSPFESVPLTVLVNEGSASASEIVAGALKHLDRAIVLGRQTFGKGTVQVLYDNDDGSALKLTIAQYLTPGDVSIQQVGITPDIVLRPVWLAPGKPARYFASARRAMRETDLEEGEPLQHEGVRSTEQPVSTVYYLEDPPRWWGNDDEEEDLDTEEPEPEEKVGDDPEVRFARDLIAQARPGRRSEILTASRAVLSKRAGEEEQQIAAALAKQGVDWSPGPATVATPANNLDATLSVEPASGRVEAGQTVKFVLRVKNKGPQAVHRVRATTKSLDLLFDERELFVGRLKAGEERRAELPVKVPRDSVGRIDDIRFEVVGDGVTPASATARVETIGPPRPLFAYGYQVIDDIAGNRDGKVQKGEHIRLRVDVRNVGPGKAVKVWTELRAVPSRPEIFIYKGRFLLGEIQSAPLQTSQQLAGRQSPKAPAPTKSADFDLEVKPNFPENEFVLELKVYDVILRDYVLEKIKIALAPPGPPGQPASGFARLIRDGVEVRSSADPNGTVIGHVSGVVPVTSRVGSWVRVDMDQRPGFVDASLTTATKDPPSFRFVAALQVTPPVLALETGARVTKNEMYELRGSVTDDQRVADLFVVVSNREAKVDAKKVFYISNRGGKDPRKLAFAAKIPVWPGQNHVTVVARENDDVISRAALVVNREGVVPQAAK